ncbi:MAG: U32 family peptidase, partial [Bacillota bacterium]|nr:U32 family peptidase [Bacillota bacterium]
MFGANTKEVIMGIELLAPAGDFTCLISAVQAGADAVYIGAGKFSARQNAANFSGEELVRALDYCHIRGVKVYLAINTLILDKELKEAIAVAKEAYEAGIDAFIVHDIGLAKILKEEFDVPLHASTQMTIFNESGLSEAEKMGFKRAVLARECGKEEIKNLAKKSKMELEVFCHGALCICYSGQCLMSSMLGGRSANRGNCAQPCRLSYSYNGQSGYYLSPKDLSLLDEISDLKAMGVSSLKIEGRMKGPVYVAAAVSIFRKVIDTGNFQKEDEITLQNAFSRGGSFTKGLYQGFRGKEMMNISSSNDNLYEGYDKALYKSMESYFKEGANLKKVKVKASFLVDSNGAKFILTDLKGRTGEAFLPLEKEEKGRAIDEELAKSQLLKLGSTPYIADTLECDIKETAYYSASELNGMRRKASDALSLARTVRREKEP